ncbi:hypothetical protein J6590_070651 [Homalodisca vitripennis]|nr:hypothetical protein J6590_070651 [Homalodisca vitripennis]
MAVSVTIICGRLGSMTGSQMFSSLIDSHCLLMFWIMSGLLICCSVTPVFFRFKHKNQTKTNTEELPTVNVNA